MTIPNMRIQPPGLSSNVKLALQTVSLLIVPSDEQDGRLFCPAQLNNDRSLILYPSEGYYLVHDDDVADLRSGINLLGFRRRSP